MTDDRVAAALDSAAIMAEHEQSRLFHDDGSVWCLACPQTTEWPCLPYVLAAEVERQPDEQTIALVWHDVTCPEGKDCRDRMLHGAPANTPVMRMLMAVARWREADRWRLSPDRPARYRVREAEIERGRLPNGATGRGKEAKDMKTDGWDLIVTTGTAEARWLNDHDQIIFLCEKCHHFYVFTEKREPSMATVEEWLVIWASHCDVQHEIGMRDEDLTPPLDRPIKH